ncbi:MAG: TolC family protein [Armatimonadetes bacterium]|nr:TolC family protein [Armatimonadota bacterium]
MAREGAAMGNGARHGRGRAAQPARLLFCVAWFLAGIRPALGAEESPAPVTVPIESGALPNIATERRSIDLPTVLRLAQEQNLVIAQAAEAVHEQEAARRGAQAQALPNVGISAGVARLLPNIATVAGVPAGRVTLFISPGRVYYDAQVAKFAVRSAEFNREGVTQDVLLEATARYANLQLAQGLVRVAEQSVFQAQELVRQTEGLQQGGLALNADVLRARAQLGEEHQRLVEAQREFKAASISLATLLRLPPAVTLVASELQVEMRTLVPPDATPDQLVERALKQRPELTQARAEIRGAEMRRKSALWGALLPTIGVERWLGGVTTDTPQPLRRTWFYAEWRLLDSLGQSARSKIDQAKSQERQARLRQEDLRDQIAGEVLVVQQAVAAAKEQVQVAQQQGAAAEASLAVFRERYQNGLGLQLDVLAGQEALTTARQNLVRAVVGYNLAQAELLTRLGERVTAGMPR